jgi:hypothetical protein
MSLCRYDPETRRNPSIGERQPPVATVSLVATARPLATKRQRATSPCRYLYIYKLLNIKRDLERATERQGFSMRVCRPSATAGRFKVAELRAGAAANGRNCSDG